MSNLYFKIVGLIVILNISGCSILHKDRPYSANSIKMIKVTGGKFSMGCKENPTYKDELPCHKVYLDDFYISKYEITFAEYDAFCKQTNRDLPSDNDWGRGNKPVINVSWIDACDYCKWLSSITGEKYRLPTEAEWEYAAKGGQAKKTYIYSGSNTIAKVAWYNLDKTNAVGLKKPNCLGIYDMSGNVWEWCFDGYDANFYKKDIQNNPIAQGVAKIARGGSWYTSEEYCRISNRDYDMIDIKDNDLGFRIVKEIVYDK